MFELPVQRLPTRPSWCTVKRSLGKIAVSHFWHLETTVALLCERNTQQHCTKTRTHTHNLLVLPFYSQWLTRSGILCFRRPAPVRTSPSKKKNKRSSQQQPTNAGVAANFTSQNIVGGQTARQTSKQKEQNYSLFQLHFYVFPKQHSWRCLIQHGRAACTPAFPCKGWRGAELACSAGSSWRFWCPAWTGEGCLHMVWGLDPGWRRNT